MIARSTAARPPLPWLWPWLWPWPWPWLWLWLWPWLILLPLALALVPRPPGLPWAAGAAPLAGAVAAAGPRARVVVAFQDTARDTQWARS